MNAVAIDIKDMIAAESSLGLTGGTNLFMSSAPESPDNLVAVYDISGPTPDLSLDNRNYFRDGVQIMVRDNSYIEAMTKAWAIITFLQGRAGETWNSVYYALIRTIMTPELLEWDSNNRAKIIFSIEAQRR